MSFDPKMIKLKMDYTTENIIPTVCTEVSFWNVFQLGISSKAKFVKCSIGKIQ